MWYKAINVAGYGRSVFDGRRRGADFDGRIKLPYDLAHAELLQASLKYDLDSAGFDAAGIKGALYGNFIEFWKKVEAAASPAQKKEQTK